MDAPHSLLDRLILVAQERRLSQKTITEYRRTWIALLAWVNTDGYALESLPKDVACKIYEGLTAKRGASHHLQVKAALSFLFKLLHCSNPFKECLAPKFEIEKVQLRYLSGSQMGMLLGILETQRQDYFSHLTYYLAQALFLTAKRYHEWVALSWENLVQVGDHQIARMKTKGGTFRDTPLPSRLTELLKEWTAFLESVKGIRVRKGSSIFAGSRLVFPGQNGEPFANKSFNQHLKKACLKAQIPQITAHGLRHTAATLLLNEKGRNLREVQALLGHRSLSTTARYTHVEHERIHSMVEELANSGN